MPVEAEYLSVKDPLLARSSLMGFTYSSLVPDIVIRTLRVTLLSDSGYALTGYEYCARIM
ncbi:hypothetical protein FA013_26820 [Raoultella planticola]|nr:hypothetical protein FA013_26820 [Raoultella planticola]